MKNNKKILVLLFISLIVLLFSSCVIYDNKEYISGDGYSLELRNGKVESDCNWVKVVEKKPNRDFVILNFTDIQFGGNSFELQSPETFAMMDKIVEQVKPDMITFTGDLSYGCPTPVYGICSKIESYGIPWAPVYGNHDHDNSGMSPETLSNVLQNYKHCLFAKGPNEESLGDYVVNIVENDGNSFAVVKSLIFMDSGTKGVRENQVLWYEKCVDAAKQFGESISSAVFMHIPVDGCKQAFDYVYPNVNYRTWNYTSDDCFGICANGSYRSNDPLTDVLYDKGSTDLFVCGHYHTNCFCIKYRGIKFVYALKTGPGCYYDEDLNGATVIKISGNGDSKVEFIFDELKNQSYSL